MQTEKNMYFCLKTQRKQGQILKKQGSLGGRKPYIEKLIGTHCLIRRQS